jgi:dihydrofolate reductase
MRKIRYIVASSLDGFIAGPNGEADWIAHDPEVDFAALWAQFDTGLMGRRTYEAARQRLGEKAFSGVTSMVFSRTMRPQDYPHATVVSELTPDWVNALRARPGKHIWLFGGSSLFRSFLDAGLVDTVEVSVIPVLLGDGVPLLPPPYSPAKLRLLSHHEYLSGRLSLVYEVMR